MILENVVFSFFELTETVFLIELDWFSAHFDVCACVCSYVQLPGIAEFATNEIMGHSADRLAAAFGVTRKEQDDYARRSHTLAQEATQKGYLSDLMAVPIPGQWVPSSYQILTQKGLYSCTMKSIWVHFCPSLALKYLLYISQAFAFSMLSKLQASLVEPMSQWLPCLHFAIEKLAAHIHSAKSNVSVHITPHYSTSLCIKMTLTLFIL